MAYSIPKYNLDIFSCPICEAKAIIQKSRTDSFDDFLQCQKCLNELSSVKYFWHENGVRETDVHGIPGILTISNKEKYIKSSWWDWYKLNERNELVFDSRVTIEKS